MIELYTDGASRGNPGHSALGAVAYKDGAKLFAISEYLGVNTNNYAEYMAALRALEKLIKMNMQNETVKLHADSKLLVEQARGTWKVKHPNIKPLYIKLKELLECFPDIEFVHVAREKNKEADSLANKALDDGTNVEKLS